MKKFIFAVFLLNLPSVSFAVNGKNAEVFTLKKSIDLAVKNNPSLLSAYQDTLIANQRVKEARFLAFPQISFSGSLTKYNLQSPMVLPMEFGGRFLDSSTNDDFYSFRAYAFQPLYTGGRNKSTLRITKTAKKEARVNYEIVERAIITDVKGIFYTLLFKKRLLEIQNSWLEEVRRLSLKFKKDKVASMEFAALTAEIESDKYFYEKEIGLTEREFKKAIGRENNLPLNIEGDLDSRPVEITLNKSLITAMEMRPELKSEIYKAKIDEIAVNMAMIKRYPNVYLGASYDALKYDMFDKSAPRYANWAASLSVQLPFSWDFWAKVMQQKAQQRKGELKRSDLRDKIRFEVIKAYENLLYWRKEVSKRKAISQKMGIDYGNLVSKNIASRDALRLSTVFYKYKKSYLKAVYKNSLAKIELESAQGKDFKDR